MSNLRKASGGDATAYDKRESIRTQLSEHYKDGFPVLKELFQNADDAGATALIIALWPGLSDGARPPGVPELLTRAAILVLNDGPFSAQNAAALKQLRGSDKSGSRSAVGRFGLGMKSVFHWGEELAHFHFLPPGASDALEPQPADILIPGAPNFGERSARDWESGESAAVDAHVRSVIRSTCPTWPADQQTLCFWIPLRPSDSGPRPLASERKGDNVPSFAAELGSLWSRFWRLLAGAEHVQRLSLVLPDNTHVAEVVESASRLWRASPDGEGQPTEVAAVPFRVHIESGEQSMVAVGIQRTIHAAIPLRGTGDWPKKAIRSDRDPEEDLHLDPLAATYLIGPRHPALLGDLDCVGADWACWFPLSGPDRADGATLRIVFHGAFHVASDRKGFNVAGQDGAGATATQRWNATLALEGAAASLPEAIRNYVETVGLSDLTTLGILTEKISIALRSLTSPGAAEFTSSFEDALCARAVWGPFLTPGAPEGVAYRCVESTRRILRLELAKSAAETSALLSAIPGLAALASGEARAILCASRTAGCIGNPPSSPWSAAEWVSLVEGLESPSLLAFTAILDGARARTTLAGSAPDEPARMAILTYIRRCVRDRCSDHVISLAASQLPLDWIIYLPDGVAPALSRALGSEYEAALLLPPRPTAGVGFTHHGPKTRLNGRRFLEIALDWYDGQPDRPERLMGGGLLELIEWVHQVCGPAEGIASAFGGRFPVYAPTLPAEAETTPRLDALPMLGFRLALSGEDDGATFRDALPLCRALAAGCDVPVHLVDSRVAEWAGWHELPEWSLDEFASRALDPAVPLSGDANRRVQLLEQLLRVGSHNRTVIRAARRILTSRDDLEADQPILQAHPEEEDKKHEVLHALAEALNALVPAPLARRLSPDACELLGVSLVAAGKLVWYILRRADRSTLSAMPFAKLPKSDRDMILAAVAKEDARDTFCALPLHERPGRVRGSHLGPLNPRGVLALEAGDVIDSLPAEVAGMPVFVQADGDVGALQAKLIVELGDAHLTPWFTSEHGVADRRKRAKVIFWHVGRHPELAVRSDLQELDWLDDESKAPLRPSHVTDFEGDQAFVKAAVNPFSMAEQVRRPADDFCSAGRSLGLWPTGEAAAARLVRLGGADALGPLADVPLSEWRALFPQEVKDRTLGLIRALDGVRRDFAAAAVVALDGSLVPLRAAALLSELTRTMGQAEPPPPESALTVLRALLPAFAQREDRTHLRGVLLPTAAGRWCAAEAVTWQTRRNAVSEAINVEGTEVPELLQLREIDFEPDREHREVPRPLSELLASSVKDQRAEQLAGVLALLLGDLTEAARVLDGIGYNAAQEQIAIISQALAQDRRKEVRATQALADGLAGHPCGIEPLRVREYAKVFEPIANLPVLKARSHLISPNSLERTLRGERPLVDAVPVLEDLLREARSRFQIPDLFLQVATYERLHDMEARSVVSLCGTMIDLDGATVTRRGSSASLYVGRNQSGDAIVLGRPRNSMGAEQWVKVIEATIRDVAEARLACVPRRLVEVLEAIASSGKRYIEWTRDEIIGNVMSWVKSQVPSVTEAANDLQEASIQAGADTRKRALKDALVDAIERSAKELARALGAQMKAYGYTPASVLFELVQNADDAVIQRRECLELPAGDEVVIDLVEPGVLTFVHWGRQLGETSGAPGKRGPSSWAADLRYMLDTMATGKHSQVVGETGAFGLGFKSVFLLTDRPMLAGGRFPPFSIDAGRVPNLLPEESADCVQLRRALDAHRRDGIAPPTVIRLPLREGTDPGFKSRFLELAPLVLLFARGVRTLEVKLPGKVLRIRQPLRDGEIVPGVRAAASVHFGSQGPRNFAVFGESAEARVALLLDDTCVSSPPPNGTLPTVWSLAPTQVSLGVPMLFQSRHWALEPGRTSLRRGGDVQANAVNGLREVLAVGLEQLLRRGGDWNAIRVELGLNDHSTQASFFASLWAKVRTTHDWHNEAPGSDAGTLHEVLWSENPTGALRRLARAGGVPDSLRSPTKLLRAELVRYVRAGAVASPDTFEAAAELAGLESECVVDESVKTTLAKVGCKEFDTLDLKAVFARWANRVKWRCSPGDALSWATAGVDWRNENQSDDTARHDTEATYQLLPNVQFEGADGTWHPAANYEGGGERLHPRYSPEAQQFIQICVWKTRVAETDAAYRHPAPQAAFSAPEPVPQLRQVDYLRALAACWKRSNDLQTVATGLNGLYGALRLPAKELRVRLADPKHADFDETWFRLLCGLSVQALLGPWDHHVKYLATLTRPKDHLAAIWKQALTDVIEETVLPWTATRADGYDWTMHHRFLVDFEKFRRLVAGGYPDRLLRLAKSDDAGGASFPRLAYDGFEPNTKRQPGAQASLKHLSCLLARELWRLGVARGAVLSRSAFFLSRHSFRACAEFGLVAVERNPADLEKRLDKVEGIVEAITEHPDPSVRETLGEWRDAPFFAYGADVGGFRTKVLCEIRQAKPTLDLQVSKEIDTAFSRLGAWRDHDTPDKH